MQTLKPAYDVVVIGSGVGGLTAAALLAKAGLSVCVLEKEPHAGGYLAGFRRKNFVFDTAIHWLNQYGPGGMVTKVFDLLGSDYPEARPQQRIRRYKGNGFDYLLTDNPDAWRDQLIREFPREEAGLRRFFAAAKKIGASFHHFNGFFRSEETMTPLQRAGNKFRWLRFALPFIPFVRYSGEKGMHRGLNKFFKDPALHRIFTAETELIGCLVPIGWAYYGDFQSPPKGGSQAIPHWLCHLIRHWGGDLLFNAPVKEIVVENGVCRGVRFAHRGVPGELRARHVVAACDVETLYEKMLAPGLIPEKLISRLRAAPIYSSSVTLSVAIDCPPSDLGFSEELVHLTDESLPYGAATSGDPERTELSVIAPSLRDPSLAPPGQGTLTIYMPAQMDFENGWKTSRDEAGNFVRNADYRDLKRGIAERLLARVEKRIAPGLRDHILFYEVATPVTHWRYTGNKNGTMMGAKPGRENMQNKIAHYRTPVPNLILGGHWAELGGGVPIAAKAGANAALLVLQAEKHPLAAAVADYMDGKIPLAALRADAAWRTYDDSWTLPATPAERLSKT